MVNNKQVVLLAACVLSVINDIHSEPLGTSYRRRREADDTYNDYYSEVQTQDQSGRDIEYPEKEDGGENWGRKRRSESSLQELTKAYKCLQIAARHFLKLANKTVKEKEYCGAKGTEDKCSSSSTECMPQVLAEESRQHPGKLDDEMYEEEDEQTNRQTTKVCSTDVEGTSQSSLKSELEERLKTAVRKRQRKSRRNRMTVATLTDEAVLKLLEFPSMRGRIREEEDLGGLFS